MTFVRAMTFVINENWRFMRGIVSAADQKQKERDYGLANFISFRADWFEVMPADLNVLLFLK